MPSHLAISYVPRNISTLPFHLPSAVFLGAQRPNLLNSEKAGKEKGHIPDGANKGKAREVVGEGVLRVFWTGGLRRGRGLTDMNTMK